MKMFYSEKEANKAANLVINPSGIGSRHKAVKQASLEPIPFPGFGGFLCGAGCLARDFSGLESEFLVCIHQAGHAVIAKTLGYEVGPAGLWLDNQAGHCDCSEVATEHHLALTLLAGCLSEWEWATPGSQTDLSDWESAHHHMHHFIDIGWSNLDSDSTRVGRLCKELQPKDPDGLLTTWILEVRTLLRLPFVWKSIENVAVILWVKRSIGVVELTAALDLARTQGRAPFSR